MFVRMLIGSNKGRMVDLQFESAHHMISSGQAEKVDFDAKEGQQSVLAAVQTVTTAQPEGLTGPPVRAGGVQAPPETLAPASGLANALTRHFKRDKRGGRRSN